MLNFSLQFVFDEFLPEAFINYWQVLLCDNLSLPYKDDSFDAVMSIAVIHHIATTERRVRAIRELARILRVGGRIIISVWSMEQRHRKFESQVAYSFSFKFVLHILNQITHLQPPSFIILVIYECKASIT